MTKTMTMTNSSRRDTTITTTGSGGSGSPGSNASNNSIRGTMTMRTRRKLSSSLEPQDTKDLPTKRGEDPIDDTIDVDAKESDILPTELGLPFGSINLLVLTDVHSWIGGHGRHEPYSDVDYGDLLSFHKTLQAHIRTIPTKDLFWVMNGDFMDGTGLSTIPPQYLTPLLEEIPFSIINLGNHELYSTETVEWLRSSFIPHWKGHYLTSNTLYLGNGHDGNSNTDDAATPTEEPLGARYVLLEGEYSTLLVFGFLYNFEGNCNTTRVEKVQDVVQQEWFVSIISKQKSYDAILVMAHMHVTDPLIYVILSAIRNIVGPKMPVQFITGHTHIRSYAILDDYSTSLEAGRFLDTIGFCSFPTKYEIPILHNSNSNNDPKDNNNIHDDDHEVPAGNKTLSTTGSKKESSSSSSSSSLLSSSSSSPSSSPPQALDFGHAFLDPNRRRLQDLAATLTSESTAAASYTNHAAGKLLSQRIHQTQQRLGLDQVVGCSPSHYYLNRSMDESQSLWGLYMYEIVPQILLLQQQLQRQDSHTPPMTTTTMNTGNGANATDALDVPASDDPTNMRGEDWSHPQVLFVQGTGAFRYDLFAGTVVLDDVIAVCPFNDTIYEITTNLTGKQVLDILNISSSSSDSSTNGNSHSRYPNQVLSGNGLPYWAVSTRDPIQEDHLYSLWTSQFHRQDMVDRVEKMRNGPIPDPTPIVDPRNGSTQHVWTTTNVWQAYVEEMWHCNGMVGSQDESSHAIPNGQDRTPLLQHHRGSHRRPDVKLHQEHPWTVVFFIALIVGGLYVYQKRKEQLARSGYVPIGDATTQLLRSSAIHNGTSNGGSGGPSSSLGYQ